MRAQVGYRRRAGHYGKPAVVAENQLEQNFDVEAPNQVWVTDITYIRTHEGWLYLAVVLDLFSRQLIGWSMRSRIDSELAINALLMAVWRRSPKAPVIVHSDQGCQYSSHDWQAFLKAHGLVPSMSRRGNCYDNAVAESFFQLLKRPVAPDRAAEDELLPAPQARAHPPQDLSRPRGSSPRHLQLHRNVLQPETPPRLCKRRFSGRVRKPVFQPATECLVKPGRFN